MLEEILKKYKDKVYFTGGVNSKVQHEFELKYAIKIPSSYARFLSLYGILEFGSLEIYGMNIKDPLSENIGLGNDLAFYRKTADLPMGFIPVYNAEDFGLYCLDSSEMVNDECKVVIWDKWEKKSEVTSYSTFEEFLKAEVESYVEYIIEA